MNCDRIDDLLATSFDEPLAPGEQAHVDAHLAECSSCANRLVGTVKTLQVLRAISRVEEEEVVPPVPESLVQRILAARTAVGRDERRKHG
jgi:predicted anti-sigma-YlaC factor YlaD